MTDMAEEWGEIIQKTLNQGREDQSFQCKITNQFDSKYENFMHFSHVMIYARTNSEFETFPKKANILMQMRFDGYIGFPGGIVDENETPQQAVNREVKEELGWSEPNGAVSESDYQFTHVDEKKEVVFHFYATEITEKKLSEIEQNSFRASDYGNEVLGNFRIPLYIMGDAFRGFPSFLRNHFVGNAKLQLIKSIANLKFLSEEQIVQALYSAPNITY